jgi:hypothetical protein
MSDGQVPAPNMGVVADLTQRPDGSWWVTVTHVTDLGMYVCWFPPNVAVEYVSNLGKAVNDAAARAQTRNSGLIVPGQD